MSIRRRRIARRFARRDRLVRVDLRIRGVMQTEEELSSVGRRHLNGSDAAMFSKSVDYASASA